MRLGRMYGRDDLIRRVARALREPGALVTLTGLPGSGRTSVARAAVTGLEGHGAGFVANYRAGHEPRVLECRAMTAPRALRIALESCQACDLLVLDDVDHVPEAVQAVAELRRERPERRVLLVARTPLGLDDEVVARVGPLPHPDPAADPEVLRGHPAVQLFLDVADRTGTAADMEDTAVGHVARICSQLGGLPLAISLVAARTATYSPATLVGLLEKEPTQFLRGRPGTGADHDLLTAVALSVSLVTPDQRALLEDLTVFHGAVGIDAVVEVCSRADVLDDLSALVDVHLVKPLHDSRGSRFVLPPLVRGHLSGTAEQPSTDLLQRHRRWARRMGKEALALERAGRFTRARELVTSLEGDLVAALADAVEEGRGAQATTVLLALLPVWFNRGATAEAIRETSTVLDVCARARRASGERDEDRVGGTDEGGQHVGAPADELALAAWHELLRAETAESSGEVSTASSTLAGLRDRARPLGDGPLLEVTCLAVQAARSLAQRELPEQWAHEGVELAQRLGDRARLARLETWCGMLAHQRGDFVSAARWARRSLERSRPLDEPSLVLRPSALLRGLPADHGRPEDIPPLDQLVELAHACGDLGVLDWLEPTAAFADLTSGDLAGAAEHSAATLRRVRTTGARLRVGPPLLCLFLLAVRSENLVWSWRLRGILARHDELLQPALPPLVAAVYDRAARTLAASAASHPGAATEIAWGSRLDVDEALEVALGFAAEVRRTHADSGQRRPVHRAQVAQLHVPAAAADQTSDHAPGHLPHQADHAPSHPAGLTERELEVLEQLVAGGTNRDISHHLDISVKTVMHHTSAIYRKLGVRGRAEAVAWHLRHPSPDPVRDGPTGLRLVQGDARP